MLYKIMYIELKSGYCDDGPAWIGRAAFSKSGQTVYFNDKALSKANGVMGNYYDIETGEEYWISGVKRDDSDRHWVGKGKIMIDRKVIGEYLSITGEKSIDLKRLEIVNIKDEYPIERANKILNQSFK
jgi:hypothetical protein